MLLFTPTPLASMTGEQGKEGDMGAGMIKGAEERAQEGTDEKIEEDDNKEDVSHQRISREGPGWTQETCRTGGGNDTRCYTRRL